MDLVSASSIGAYSTVDDILRNNLEDVNTVNSSGWTPVMYAANYGHFNIIRLLIRYGCDVDHRDWQGRTALMLAASNGHTRCLDVLINYGKADKSLKDMSGTDAYKYAKNCGHGNNKLIKTLLLKTEGYELRGRQFNAPTPAPSPVNKPRNSFPFTQNTAPEDEIYNPYETTAFSNSLNSFWRKDKKVDLNQLKDQIPTMNASNESLTSDGFGTSPPESLQPFSCDEVSVLSSSQSSSHSSIISAPKSRRKSIVGRKKSSVEAISSPMPITLFHLLTRIELIQYLDLFEGNGIDFYQFLTLTDEDFQKLGITNYGHRKKLSIARLRFHEALDIHNTQESFLADFLLQERELLNQKIKELEQKLSEMNAKNN